MAASAKIVLHYVACPPPIVVGEWSIACLHVEYCQELIIEERVSNSIYSCINTLGKVT